MTKAVLLIDMIDRLRRNPGLTISELASRLNRSERTIYRWLSELTDEIGASVTCRDGGYYLSENNHSTPTLTAEELVVVRMSLKSTPFPSGSQLMDRAQSAWLKIRDNAPARELRDAGEIGAGYSVQLTAPKGYGEPEIARTLEKAVQDRQRLRITYRSQKSNQVKSYTIDPYALVFRRHSWYLLAHCVEYGRIVQFRLARFREILQTGESFEPPSDFSAEDYFSSSWEAWGGGDPVSVRVRFSPKVSVMVAESKRHPTQVTHTQPDGSIIFEATVAGIEEIAIWIMGFGKEAEVLDPPELRDHVAGHVKAMARLYQATAPSPQE